jgi:hypothetical protein
MSTSNVIFVLTGILSTTLTPIFAASSVIQLRGESDRQLAGQVEVNHVNYVYPSKEIPYHWFGEAVAVNDNMAIIGAPGTEDFSNYGVAYVYHKQGNGKRWGEVAVLEPPTKGVYASFGASVSIFEGCAFVGAPK